MNTWSLPSGSVLLAETSPVASLLKVDITVPDGPYWRALAALSNPRTSALHAQRGLPKETTWPL